MIIAKLIVDITFSGLLWYLKSKGQNLCKFVSDEMSAFFSNMKAIKPTYLRPFIIQKG